MKDAVRPQPPPPGYVSPRVGVPSEGARDCRARRRFRRETTNADSVRERVYSLDLTDRDHADRSQKHIRHRHAAPYVRRQERPGSPGKVPVCYFPPGVPSRRRSASSHHWWRCALQPSVVLMVNPLPSCIAVSWILRRSRASLRRSNGSSPPHIPQHSLLRRANSRHSDLTEQRVSQILRGARYAIGRSRSSDVSTVNHMVRSCVRHAPLSAHSPGTSNRCSQPVGSPS